MPAEHDDDGNRDDGCHSEADENDNPEFMSGFEAAGWTTPGLVEEAATQAALTVT